MHPMPEPPLTDDFPRVAKVVNLRVTTLLDVPIKALLQRETAGFWRPRIAKLAVANLMLHKLDYKGKKISDAQVQDMCGEWRQWANI